MTPLGGPLEIRSNDRSTATSLDLHCRLFRSRLIRRNECGSLHDYDLTSISVTSTVVTIATCGSTTASGARHSAETALCLTRYGCGFD